MSALALVAKMPYVAFVKFQNTSKIHLLCWINLALHFSTDMIETVQKKNIGLILQSGPLPQINLRTTLQVTYKAPCM